MQTSATSELVNSRFAAALGLTQGKREVFDTALFELPDFVVVPSLGSMIPNWLLAIPRKHELNLHEWGKSNPISLSSVLQNILARSEFDAEDAIWFEHGPAHELSKVGCGIDHAHLHVLLSTPILFESFAQAAISMSHRNWIVLSGIDECYATIKAGSSYLCAGSANKAILLEDVEALGSQFFRRVIAHILGCTEAWDYRKHPCLENVARTIDALG